MKAAQWFGQKDVRVVEVPEPPSPPKGWVKIKVAFCGICGTDLHEYLNGPCYLPTTEPHVLGKKVVPLTLGHEAAGTVVELGPDVTNVKVGDRVSIDCCLSCGECDMCKAGQYQVCEHIGFYGLHCDGAFAEYVNMRADRMNIIPDSMSFETATVIEPLAVALHAVRQVGLLIGDRCVVLGCGPIGISAILSLRAGGAREVYAIEQNKGRIEAAKKAGATKVFTPDDGDVLAMVKEATQGGADIVIECIGNDISAQLAIDCAHNRGKICIVGNYLHPTLVNFSTISNTEKQLVGALCYNNDFERCIKLVENGQIDVDQLVSGKIYIDDIATKGFDALVETPGNYLKVLVTAHKEYL